MVIMFLTKTLASITYIRVWFKLFICKLTRLSLASLGTYSIQKFKKQRGYTPLF